MAKKRVLPTEINTLAYLLKKLDYFHNDIYINKRGQTLNDILNGITIEKTDPYIEI